MLERVIIERVIVWRILVISWCFCRGVRNVGGLDDPNSLNSNEWSVFFLVMVVAPGDRRYVLVRRPDKVRTTASKNGPAIAVTVGAEGVHAGGDAIHEPSAETLGSHRRRSAVSLCLNGQDRCQCSREEEAKQENGARTSQHGKPPNARATSIRP